MSTTFFTSESVTEGHPDKVCDQIADRILDELLKQDPYSRCACEVTAEHGALHIMGEITSDAQVDYEACAREVIREIGYTDPEYGFTDKCVITCSIHRQSADIAMGVDSACDSMEDIGAGDQGMMFGYACNETENKMPFAIELANTLTKRLAYLRKNDVLSYLRPDGKSQVTVEYIHGAPRRIEALVISAQHDPDVEIGKLRSDILEHVVKPTVPTGFIDGNTKIYINPTGRFVLGGPAADTGLTGRKIISDTYGSFARSGGGALSGKDPTKVDRSASYMARYIAKHIVAAGLADRCEIQLSYAIGVAMPVSVSVENFGTGNVPERVLESWINENVGLRPGAIIEKLQLRRPIYSETSVYGHFGRSAFPWERLDGELLESLRALSD
ncbi:MAG: methionine adenosyltransferase [Oscillospiraceae bacterium]